MSKLLFLPSVCSVNIGKPHNTASHNLEETNTSFQCEQAQSSCTYFQWLASCITVANQLCMCEYRQPILKCPYQNFPFPSFSVQSCMVTFVGSYVHCSGSTTYSHFMVCITYTSNIPTNNVLTCFGSIIGVLLQFHQQERSVLCLANISPEYPM